MTIGFEPIVIGIGPYAVRAFGVLALVGVRAGLWLTLRTAKDAEGVARALVWAERIGWWRRWCACLCSGGRRCFSSCARRRAWRLLRPGWSRRFCLGCRLSSCWRGACLRWAF